MVYERDGLTATMPSFSIKNLQRTPCFVTSVKAICTAEVWRRLIYFWETGNALVPTVIGQIVPCNISVEAAIKSEASVIPSIPSLISKRIGENLRPCVRDWGNGAPSHSIIFRTSELER